MYKSTDFEQNGFDAIADTMKKLYPNQKGIYYGNIIPGFLGGNNTLDGVEVWKSEDNIPHWHYVTYGFTELFEKEREISEESGYGFELSFYLKQEDEEQPPVWPVNLLQNLARYVFSSGNVFRSGHHMDCNSPVALETDTKLTALAFRKDPQLGEMDTPNGHMTFLQAVAITSDELEAIMCWNCEKFLKEMDKEIPMCITDLSRSSCMDIPSFYDAWKKGVETDGSFNGFFYLENLGADLKDGRAMLTLGAGHDKVLSNMLKARLGKGRDLFLHGSAAMVNFLFGEEDISLKDGVLTLTMPETALAELCEILKSHKGIYPLTSFPLTVEITATNITDQDGNVIKTIE